MLGAFWESQDVPASGTSGCYALRLRNDRSLVNIGWNVRCRAREGSSVKQIELQPVCREKQEERAAVLAAALGVWDCGQVGETV